MNTLITLLPAPLNTIVIENKCGEYKDFELEPENPYPLRGVTYSTDYGYLPGYMGQDDAELDFFVGTQQDGNCGYFIVSRGEGNPDEHKFYVAMSQAELDATLKEFSPVIQGNQDFDTIEDVLEAIEPFKSS